MIKNEVTTVSNLQIGDRFYFQNDKNKVVWEKIEQEAKNTHFRTYNHFAIIGSYADRIACPKRRNQHSKGIMSSTKVVYLRSKEVK